eukprot:UN04753
MLGNRYVFQSCFNGNDSSNRSMLRHLLSTETNFNDV